ncbi:MAG: penicillin-binding protein [Proteobacteria bacterium]|nr:penicillin-binding protein [Pseudomonadota bacterium]
MFRILLTLGFVLSVLGFFVEATMAARDSGVTSSRGENQAPADIDNHDRERASSGPKIKGSTEHPFDEIDLTKMHFENGRYVDELSDGRRVTFTVDPTLQRFADDMFAKYEVPAGAAVLLNSRTGRVLAFSQQRRSPNLSKNPAVALDPSPPAASLFKIVTAAALLEKGNVQVDTKTCYRGGSSRLLLEHLADSPLKKSACAKFSTALGRSINAIFAKLSDRRLERVVLQEYADRFGFNSALPFDIPFGKSKAQIPNDRLERARTAAGFWHTYISPLHAAVIAQSLAQGGAMLRPYIVDRIENSDGVLLHEAKSKYLNHIVKKETAQALVRAMTHTVRRGTARKAFRDRRGVPYLPGVEVSGKTGTLTGKKPYRAYTWFVGVAPVERPQVAISVLIINEPKWRIKASQAAAQLLKKYFEISRKRS